MHVENINNLPSLKYYRKKLRNNPTQQKSICGNSCRRTRWIVLNSEGNKALGHTVDFYTYQYNLAIELDGEIHDEEEMLKHDFRRDDYLRNKGVKVLRFKNSEVFEDVEKVLSVIRNEFI